MSISRNEWKLPGSFPVMLALSLIFPSCFSAASKDDDNEDLPRTLSTNLAPFLALLGERVTMQFFSQMTGCPEKVILSMVPLGILTIMVSAIRVGGPNWLKAVVGRARENLVTAELELMSSTSKETCELWNGQTVVRCQGSAPVWEFICVLPRARKAMKSGGNDTKLPVALVMTLEEAIERGILQERKSAPMSRTVLEKSSNTFRKGVACAWALAKSASVMWIVRGKRTADEEDANPAATESSQEVDAPGAVLSSQRHPTGLGPNEFAVIRNVRPEAPNITLNTYAGFGRVKLGVVCFLSILVQLIAVTYNACRTYHPSLSSAEGKKPDKIVSYAFPLAASGTVVLAVGIFMCSHVVERCTIERTYEVAEKSSTGTNIQILWLQKENKVSDQFFDSVAIHSKEARDSFSTSSRAAEAQKERQPKSNSLPSQGKAQVQGQESSNMDSMKKLEVMTIIGVILSLAGFSAQFMGQGRLHWSTLVVNLGATIIMVILRAFVRLNHLERLATSPLESRFELDWLTRTLVQYGDTFNKSSEDSQLVFGKTRTELPGSESSEKASEGFTILTAYGGTRTHGGVLSPTTVTSAFGMLLLRRDLARLAVWRGPAAAEAIRLAKSIELTRKAFCPLSRTGSGKSSWELKVQRGQADAESIFIAISWCDGRWHIRADDLEAALSLWLHSASVRQQTGTSDNLDSAEEDSWLRGQDPQTHLGLRLLAPSTSSLMQDLKWWMPDELTGLLRAEEDIDSSLLDQSQRLQVDQTRVANSGRGLPWEPERNNSPETRSPPSSGMMTWKLSPAQGHESTKGRNSEVAGATVRESFVATLSHDPIEKLYAQDLFSAFMWALARDTFHIEGGLPTGIVDIATIRPSNAVGLEGWKQFALRSESLAKLAHDIENTGLGSPGQIYQSMIPALSIYDKLPRLDAVVDLVRDHGMIHEHSRHWKEALGTYSWLFQVTKAYGPGTSIYRKALAILLSFERRLALHWQLGCGSDGEPGPMGFHGERTAVKGLIKSADPTAVQALRKWPVLSDRDTLIHLPAKNDQTAIDQDDLETRGQYLSKWNRPKGEEPTIILTSSNEDMEARDVFESRPCHYAASRPNDFFIDLAKQPNSSLQLGAFQRSTDTTLHQWTSRHSEAL